MNNQKSTQDDVERAQKCMSDAGRLCIFEPCGLGVSCACRNSIITLLSAIRAEATLAGAAAERDRLTREAKTR